MEEKIIQFNDIELTDLREIYPQEIADIVSGQLQGYGYDAGYYNNRLYKVDTCYSNDGKILITEADAESLLNDAIEYRAELLFEKYDEDEPFDTDDESVQEYRKMTNYYKETFTK